MSAGAFAKISQAQATGGGNNIRDGVYKFLIEKVHIQSGHTGECFIAEFRVADAGANGALDDNGHPVTPNSVGSTCSMVCNLTKHESAAGNAKGFVVNALAGLGHTADKITPEVMAWVCSDQNPLRGLAVVNETYRTVNKGRANPANAGKPLTLNKFKPITQTEEEVNAHRAWLDANPPRVDSAAQQPAAQAVKLEQVAAAMAPAVAAAPTPPAPAAAAAPPKTGGILSGLGSLK